MCKVIKQRVGGRDSPGKDISISAQRRAGARLPRVKGRRDVPLKVENDTFGTARNLIWLRFTALWNLM